MAPVAAMMSGNSSGATKSKTQSIAWPGPAMKPSSDIDLFTTTLPFPVLVSLMPFLQESWDDPVIRSGTAWAAILVIPLALTSCGSSPSGGAQPSGQQPTAAVSAPPSSVRNLFDTWSMTRLDD